MSTSSVFSSIRSSVRDSTCHATRSTTPRSPKWLNETSGRTSQPWSSTMRVTVSAIAAWRLLRSRSSPAPRHRGSRASRTSSTPATRRSVAILTRSISPRSIREYVDVEVPARSATSAARQPRRMRSSRNTRPMARSSTGTILTSAAYAPITPGSLEERLVSRRPGRARRTCRSRACQQSGHPGSRGSRG